MQWSPQQDAALKAIAQWRGDSSRPVFRLFGYAGTGKTLLARHFAETFGGNVLFGAFTGKAASVMRDNGCFDATTIHRLIYTPAPKSEVRLLELREALEKADPEDVDLRLQLLEEIRITESELKMPAFVLNMESPVREADLLIIDEVSMVNEEIGKDLLSFKVPILVLGDPAQLPPVRGTGFFLDQEPDAMLTEIHRQAMDSPIIRLATEVRNGRHLKLGTYGESVVIPHSDFDRSTALHYDQILVGRNKTRSAVNKRARVLLGRGGVFPEPQDKLVCLRNNHELGILNGEIWYVVGATEIDEDTALLAINQEEHWSVDEVATLEVIAHTHYFKGKEPGFFELRQAQCFDYGYALTVHKAQGSQWDVVLVFDESGCFRGERARWLYTAITRAAERVTILTEY